MEHGDIISHTSDAEQRVRLDRGRVRDAGEGGMITGTVKRPEWGRGGRAASCYQGLQGAPRDTFTSVSSTGIQ